MQTIQLSPLPIPTGRAAGDMGGIIGHKTPTYLDICAEYAIGYSFVFLWSYAILLFTPVILIMGWENVVKNNTLIIGLTIICSPIILGCIYALFKSAPLPVMRFNRERREVYIRIKKQYWRVPWEQIKAETMEVNSYGRHGVITQAIFNLYAPHPETGDYTAVFSCQCGFAEGGFAQWECIRSFMEIGAEACPEPSIGNKHPIHDGAIGRLIARCKECDLLGIIGNLISIVVFGQFLVDFYNYWKLNEVPDFTNEEILAWSLPIPKEKWATPSEELQQAIANQQQALAEQELNG